MITFEKAVKLKYVNLHQYKLRNWDVIALYRITYQGKNYIVGRQTYNYLLERSWDRAIYLDDYSMSDWASVGEDFLEILKNIKIQEILKNKSKDKTDIHTLKKDQRKWIHNNPSKT